MKKFFGRLFLLILVVAVICSAVIAADGYKMYRDAVDEVSIVDTVSAIRSSADFTSADNVPEIYLDAVVAAEDRRFYMHKGIDFISICRAIYTNIKSGGLVEGGSTITQQLAKNMYFPMDKTAKRKIAEMFVAWQLEKNYTKEEILELYINNIYFGSGYYCVKAASVGYFNKKPANMNDYESTMLAGIPNAPSVYSPDVNPALAKQRQEQVLEKMVENGVLSESEAEKIKQMQ